jgi:thymidylate synthase ThyX
MMRYTFCVDTQISTSRELNRVSPNSIAEKSTRYVYEDGSICRRTLILIEILLFKERSEDKLS